MHLPKGKYEVNVNTGIQIITFLVMIAGGGALWGTLRNDVDKNTRTITAVELQLKGVETQVRQFDNLAYRLNVQEQGAANLARVVDELKVAINGQGSDLKVIREILTRIDQAR